MLARLVSLDVENVTLSDALAQLRHHQGIPLAYSADIIPSKTRITLAVTTKPLGSTLVTLLEGSGLEIVVTREGTVVIVPRRPRGVSTVTRGSSDLAVERVRLATGIRRLDQLVVMGSAVAGAPEREQPTAVTVINADGLAQASHTRVADLVRTMLPGVVLWDRGPAGPPAQITSVRGVSSFTSRALKTYVDGVELASPDLFTLLDGRSIERMEVIRGPQGAALYGPDALNGVLQIVTRKGRPGTAATHVRGAVTAGPYERADLTAPVLYQDHALGLSGGATRVGYDLSGSYAQSGSPDGAAWLRSWTTNGGGQALLGPVVLQASARAGRYEYSLERYIPDVTALETSPPLSLEERGFGVSIIHPITSRWRQTLVTGYHWVSGAREETRPTLLTPRLPLGATHETASRASIRYSTVLDLALGRNEASLSAGAEHGNRTIRRSVRRTLATRDLLPLYDDDLRSTGVFGQTRVRLGDHFVVTGGTRAEWSSSVGTNQGAAWASSAGLSWSRNLGQTTLRLRGAWGRGIRPPDPGMSRAMATATIQQEPNPDLTPETQSGVEGGVELFLGDRAHVRVTGYLQRANDLIQQVQVRSDGATRGYQFQNVGAIANRGIEFEAGMRWRRVAVTGLFYLTDSEVRELAPRYTGDLEPGDQLLEVPSNVGALSVRYDGGRFQAEIGGSWLGPWIGYDWTALKASSTGTAPIRARVRDYWEEYPGVLRPYVALGYRVAGDVSAFMRVDNPANDASLIQDNLSPRLGRSTLVGLILQP